MKIYVESSVPNFLFHSDSPEKQQITIEFFKNRIKNHNCFVSDLVLDELEKTPEPKRTKLLEVVSKHKLSALRLTREAMNLADRYVKEGIIPKKYATDALHVAIAVVNEVDVLLSWNMKHIVRVKTIKGVNAINVGLHYPYLLINTPEEV